MTGAVELAGRVEGAAGADRELDEAIMGLLFLRKTRFIGVRYTDGRRSMSKVWVDPATGKWVSTHARKFTGSIDAAMTLVTGYCTLISLSEIAADGLPLARVGRPDLDGMPIFTGCAFGITLGTPLTTQLALALTAAALRARASTPPVGR